MNRPGVRTGNRAKAESFSPLKVVYPQSTLLRIFVQASQRYERGSTFITSNLPFYECIEVLGSERLNGTPLNRLTHHIHILHHVHIQEMNNDSYRLKQSRRKRSTASER